MSQKQGKSQEQSPSLEKKQQSHIQDDHITKIDDTLIKPKHIARCHCGAVELELMLPNGIELPRRCNCSLCLRKGAVVGSIALSGLRIVKGEEYLNLYQFNTRGC